MSKKPNKRAAEARAARTQRSISAELGISRTKLKRLLADGLPARRQGDKLVMDMAEARAWIEQHEGAGRALAPVLHPDDPRHRERTAAAAIRQIEADVRRGAVVRMDDVLQRFDSELGALRHTLLGIPALFTLPVDDIEAALSDAIEGALAELQADDSKLWPKPQQVLQFATSVEQGVQNGPPVERDTLPLLLPGDPRHAFASAQADIKESKLLEAQAGVVTVADALAMIRDFYAQIRERLRVVPACVALALEDGASVFDVVRDQIYEAMGEISGAEPEEDASGGASNIDAQGFDDVDGEGLVSSAFRPKADSLCSP